MDRGGALRFICLESGECCPSFVDLRFADTLLIVELCATPGANSFAVFSAYCLHRHPEQELLPQNVAQLNAVAFKETPVEIVGRELDFFFSTRALQAPHKDVHNLALELHRKGGETSHTTDLGFDLDLASDVDPLRPGLELQLGGATDGRTGTLGGSTQDRIEGRGGLIEGELQWLFVRKLVEQNHQ
jgi:hypothetical protein